MTGKKVIITGVPGVGKTSVITESIRRLDEEGVPYQSINFGTFMFEVAQKENIVQDRDAMRKLDKNSQKRLQQLVLHRRLPGLMAMSSLILMHQ